jgi:hypothetical protein
MPRIGSGVVDGVFYLFSTPEKAARGKDPGGTGFIVRWGWSDIYYAVTNWHVACKRGYSVIRLNTLDGGADIIDFGPEDWEFEPAGPDVAIAPLNLDKKLHKISSFSTYQFANKNDLTFKHIDLGDDVFMVGLFIDHAGETTNVPSVRFGNIGMMPNEKAPIKQPTGCMGESFIIDMHSRTGFSGSPVYVYRTVGSDLTQREIVWKEVSRRENKVDIELYQTPLFRLLGIHWGQFPEKWELKASDEIGEGRKNDLIIEGAYVEGMSGMTCVVPAWEIDRLLDMPQLKYFRGAESAAPASEPKEE